MYTAANYTAKEVAKGTDTPQCTVEAWVNRRIIKPTHKGDGTGHCNLFSPRDALAIKVGRDLRQRGMTIKCAAAAMNWLMARDIDELSRNWSVGRKLMLIVGDSVLPVLATRDEIFNNPDLDLVAASTAGVPVAVVDVQAAYDEMNRKIVAHRDGRDEIGEKKTELGALPVERKVPA